MRASRGARVALLVCLGTGILSGCGEIDPQPPTSLVALINSSAPDGDVSGTQFCAGVLIAKSTVLTAAHCVRTKPEGSFDVIVGADNLCQTAPIVGERFSVHTVVMAPDVDAAVITIDGSSDGATSIENRRPIDSLGDTMIAWGWGKDSIGGTAPCTAQPKPLNFVQRQECADSLVDVASEYRDRYLCAIPRTDVNTCEGDSGGPLFSADGQLVAITVGGIGCGPRDPGTYLAVETLNLD